MKKVEGIWRKKYIKKKKKVEERKLRGYVRKKVEEI